DTSIKLFGKKLSFPLVVTAITGGYPKAERINANIAEACQELQIGMGVGSQRAALEKGEDRSYTLLKEFDIPLRIGNVGVPQLVQQRRRPAFDKSAIQKALDMIDAHILGIHLNFLQEVVQPQGDTNAKGCLSALREVAREFPVIVKETGAGISNEVALKLKGTGIRGIDVSGTGGTSFSAVEMFRSERIGDEKGIAIGETFRDWGIPAPVSVILANVGLPLIASGGILNGLHMAKGIALGASCAGVARPLLEAALESSDRVKGKLELMRDEFRAAMFLTGSRKVSDLGEKEFVVTGTTRNWLLQTME
ncbi:MAG: type 2 isopentenyl-diphosphate Delta-isomerase, partial [Euryarchaeota archaeon]|nr:type 2 isopentenyl-diphosphate Delta-isomerase [Euryarchaeota archaeon]